MEFCWEGRGQWTLLHTAENPEFTNMHPSILTHSSHACGSRRASQTWYILNSLPSTFCRVSLVRSTARRRSSGVRKGAEPGASGSKSSSTSPHAVVMQPKMINRYCQGHRAPWIWPIPHARTPPKRPAAEFPCGMGCEYHFQGFLFLLLGEMAARAGWTYHVPDTMTVVRISFILLKSWQ
jgi:hypothetical protein